MNWWAHPDSIRSRKASLHDAEGRPCLYFRVAEGGTVEIQVLDENGETVKDLTK